MKISCPACGQHYECPDEWEGKEIKCQRCGSNFSIVKPEQVTKIQKCPYCLAEIPSSAKKCSHCGEWLVPHTERTKDRMTYLILAFFFGNWGLAEAYLGRIFTFVGAVIVNIFCLCRIENGGLLGIVLLWLGFFAKAVGTNISTRKLYKSARIIFTIILLLFLLLVVPGTVIVIISLVEKMNH